MRLLRFVPLLLLAGCGGLPQPFFGNPGSAGARLSAPPPARLAVLTPTQSLLTNAASDAWASETAAALLDQGLPASHAAPTPGDWRLVLAADVRGAAVLPRYDVVDPTGAPKGSAEGAPVPMARWAQNDPAVLKAAARQAAPGIDALLTRILAAWLHDDPNSLQNRPARVYLSGVKGAPGDGDRSLAAQMRTKLAGYGIVVQDTATGSDYQLRGEITTALAAGGQLKIELQWVVDDPRGERGRVVQLNEVPAASIARFWGDVAVVVAEQAAGGVKDVLFNAAGPRLGGETK